MNAPCRRFHLSVSVMSLLAALAASGARAASAPATPAPTIQQQIDALLKHRTRPEPLPVDPPNPFVLTTKGIRDTLATDTSAKPATPEPPGVSAGGVNQPKEFINASNSDILAAVAVRLKIGGMMRINDQVKLMINDASRKEGDFITTIWNNANVHIRIVKILPGQLILRLEDAEVTLKY